MTPFAGSIPPTPALYLVDSCVSLRPCSYTTFLKTLPFSTFFYNPPLPCLSPAPDCKLSF